MDLMRSLSGDELQADVGLVGDRRVPMTLANDVDVLDFFIGRHEMAIDMAEDVIERGENEQVRELLEMADDIYVAQGWRSGKMHSLLEELLEGATGK